MNPAPKTIRAGVSRTRPAHHGGAEDHLSDRCRRRQPDRRRPPPPRPVGNGADVMGLRGSAAFRARLMGRGASMRQVLLVAFLSASLALVPSALAQRGDHHGGSGHPAGSTMGPMGSGFRGSSFGSAPRFAGPGSIFESHAPNFVSTAPTHAVSTAPVHAFVPYRRAVCRARSCLESRAPRRPRRRSRP